MASIAVRQNTYNALNATQKEIVRWVAARLELGQPAVYLNGATPWLIYDDDRITLDDIAVLGTVAANLAALSSFVLQQGVPTRGQLATWAQNRVKWPAQIDYTGQANPYAFTLSQNGAPASVQAADSVPATWTPQ